MYNLRQAKETNEFTNVWTNDRKILFKSDSNTNHKFTIANFFNVNSGKH